MSQDLFAAFGEAPSPAVNEQATRLKDQKSASWAIDASTTFGDKRERDASFSNHGNDPEIYDEDDFGDFEDASAAVVDERPVPKPGNHSGNSHINRGSLAVAPASHGVDRPKASQTQKYVKPLPFKPKTEESNIGQHPFAGHMDILFDADDDDDYNAGTDELGDLSSNPEAAMAYSKRLIAEQQAAAARKDMIHDKNVRPTVMTTAKNLDRPFERDERAVVPTKNTQQQPQQVADVLFDADDPEMQVDEDDDWGDFEGTSQDVPTSTNRSVANAVQRNPEGLMHEVDLLGIDDNHAVITNNTSHKDQHATSAKAQNLPQSTTVSVSQKEDSAPTNDTWDDFEPTNPNHGDNQPDQISQQSKSVEAASTPSHVEPELPPTNIPPPTVLLSTFPTLFARANEDLLSTLNKLPTEQKQELLAHPASIQYLEAYLKKCMALAYIVAGRKMRWKRDQRLVQSMRIGPAAPGGRGGMKLVGVDKSEIAKEDRETVDTVRLYRAQMGKLQSAVTGATTAQCQSQTVGQLARLIPVPNIEEQMIVKALKTAEGGLTGPRPCALCGLKREERVVKVDKEVEDSFGEWWVEGIEMHVVCRDFWKQEGERLRGR